jgi:hypothetical protein
VWRDKKRVSVYKSSPPHPLLPLSLPQYKYRGPLNVYKNQLKYQLFPPFHSIVMGHPKFSDTPVYTASNGAPIFNPNASQRVGTSGPLLLQDFHLIDLLAHFDRERIPERYYSNPCVDELTNNVVLSMPRVPVHMVSSR